MARPISPYHVVNPSTLAVLVECFKQGMSDEEACLIAGIAPNSLYNYCREHPDFSEQKQALKKHPIAIAKKTVCGKLESDVNTAKWYLERKAASEFGQQIKVQGQIDHIHQLPDKQITEIITNLLQDNEIIDAEIIEGPKQIPETTEPDES